MPLYEFKCEDGHIKEAICKMDLSNAPTKCEHPAGENTDCGKPVQKIMSTNAKVFPGADSWR